MLKWKNRYKELKKPNIPSLKKIKETYNHDVLIKLNYNESNFGASPKVLNYDYKLIDPHRYPDYHSEFLLKKLSSLYKLNQDNFWISNGSDAILDAIPSLFSLQNENIIIPDLTYGRILQTSIVQGVDVKRIPLKNGYLDLDKTLKKIDNKTSIIYIVNPNMPTGRSYSHEKIDNFISKVPKNILIVIDEAYIEFAVGIKNSFELDHNLIKKYDNLLITRTFSKMFALAGYRIGYMIASKATVDLFKKAIQVFPLSSISTQFAYQALLDIPYYENIYRINKEEKKKYYVFLDQNKIDYFKSASNFIYINTKNETWQNSELRLFLLKKYKVLIRNVLDIGLRITIGTPDQNILVQNGIQEFLDAQ